MRLTIDAASKLIKTYMADLAKVEQAERNGMMVTYLDGEDKVIPEYSFVETQAEMNKINENIQRIKHQINVFNCSYVLPEVGITIDTALIRMAVLNKRMGELDRMRGIPKKSRTSSYRSDKPEYSEPNFDVKLAKAEYERTRTKLLAIQGALNKANILNEIEVELV